MTFSLVNHKKSLTSFFVCLALCCPYFAFASASLTVSSASLATDGKTITVNIGGVSGSLSPSTGIYGVTIKVGSIVYPTSTPVTASGSTLTVVTSALIATSTTVTVDLSASPTSNLTDSGGNTPQGQTGRSVTNYSGISLSSFNASSTEIIYSGVTAPTTASTFSLGSRNGQLDVLITGTCANFRMNTSAGGTFTFTVDGVTSTVTSIGSQQNWALFCGLSDTAHRVKITSNGATLVNTGFLEVRGSAPAISRVTDIGNIYNLQDPTASSSLRFSSGWVYDGTYVSYKTYWSDEKISFNSAATQIDAWIYNKNAPLYLERDGVIIASTTPSGASTWGYVTLASNLDGQSHTYTIGTGGYVSTYSMIYGLALLNGTLGSQPSAISSSSIGGYGDSITAANQTCLSYQSFLYSLASRLGVIPINRGIGGSRVIGASSPAGEARTTDLTGATPAPSHSTILYGINDVGTSAAFLTSYTNMLNSLTGALPTTKFIVMGLLKNSYTAQRNIDIRSAITANGSTNLHYIDTSGWTLPDMNGNHPGIIGYNNMTNYLAPYVSTTGYTVSGPTIGLPNQASTNFTVTLANSGAFDGTTTISIMASDGAIGATATGGTITNNNTSSVTVKPAIDTSSFTFTYAPASVGAKTLTFTNGQGWTNPNVLTYSASSLSASPDSITQNSAGNVVTLTGGSSNWTSGTPGSPTFTLAGGTGASITAQTITSATGASLQISAGSSVGTLVITDPNSGATTSVAVAADADVPVVSLASPSSGTVRGAINVVAQATDNIAIAGVKFYYNSTLIGAEVVSASSPDTYSLSWDTTALTDGSYTLVAVARDAVGNSATSSPVNVVVDNIANVVTNETPVHRTSGRPIYAFVDKIFNQPTDGGVRQKVSTLTKNLSFRMVDPQIKSLQQYLNSHGFIVSSKGAGSSGKETNYFGEATRQAVIRFQKAKGVKPASGLVGPKTRKVMGF